MAVLQYAVLCLTFLYGVHGQCGSSATVAPTYYTAATGNVASANPYGNNQFCRWVITAPAGQVKNTIFFLTEKVFKKTSHVGVYEGRAEITATPLPERRCSSHSWAWCLFSVEYPPWKYPSKCLGYEVEETEKFNVRQAFQRSLLRRHQVPFWAKIFFLRGHLPIVEISMSDIVFCLTKDVGKEKWSAIDRFRK